MLTLFILLQFIITVKCTFHSPERWPFLVIIIGSTEDPFCTNTVDGAGREGAILLAIWKKTRWINTKCGSRLISTGGKHFL